MARAALSKHSERVWSHTRTLQSACTFGIHVQATHIARERRAVFGGFSLPTFVLDLLLASLDASVEQRAGFKPLGTLSPLAHAPSCDAPALFVRARRDPLISQDHVEVLAKRYKGPRTLALVEGTHSSPRDVDARAAQESEIPNFKGSDLGRFPLVLADFWTSDHLSERSRSVNAFPGTRARGTLTLKRR